MKLFKLNIQQKIQFYVLTATFVIFAIAVGFIGLESKKRYLTNAILLSEEIAEKNALKLEEKLESDLTIPRTLANSVKEYKRYPQEEWKDLFAQMYINVLKVNPQIDAIWDTWELKVIDSAWTKPYGRYSYICWWDNGKIKDAVTFFRDQDSPQYARLKAAATENVDEPYFYSYGDEDSVLLTDLVAPILDKGKWIGLVAIDFKLDKFQDIVNEIKPFEGSYAFLLSNEGNIIGHPLNDQLGRNIEFVFPGISKKYKILNEIKAGKSISFTSNINKSNSYFIFKPVNIGNTEAPWSLALVVPSKTIRAESNRILFISISVGIIGLILLSVIIWILSNNITSPIKKITSLLTHLSTGEISAEMKVDVKSGDEIADMATRLNEHIDSLSLKADFAENIGQGNFSSELNALGERDVLGNALTGMKENLHNAKTEEEKRKDEDQKRRWINEGLAKFGDLLRQNNDDLSKLTGTIIQNLVNYLEANQGGIFLLKNAGKDDAHFNLEAAFAYDRRKYLEKTINVGEGLISACAFEKKTIYLTDIPEGYIQITSGLGGTSPGSILIIPLLLEETALGVVEIASFNEFEKYQIEFVEKIGESIASTLNSVQINQSTKELLERSQQQAEEMAAQDEEMRQNLEELQATQEESARKSAEMEGLIEALNTSSFVMEYDTEGYMRKINDNYLNLIGKSRENVIGKHHSAGMEFTEEQRKKYDKFWDDLNQGIVKKEISNIKIKNKTFKFAETYTPIRNEEGTVIKVLKISNNITE